MRPFRRRRERDAVGPAFHLGKTGTPQTADSVCARQPLPDQRPGETSAQRGKGDGEGLVPRQLGRPLCWLPSGPQPCWVHFSLKWKNQFSVLERRGQGHTNLSSRAVRSADSGSLHQEGNRKPGGPSRRSGEGERRVVAAHRGPRRSGPSKGGLPQIFSHHTVICHCAMSGCCRGSLAGQ